MAEKDFVVKEKLDHSGVFDFPAFYAFAHGWLKYEEYIIVEDEYTEKVSGNSREMMIKWTASKTLTDYFKIEIKMKLEVYGLTDVEVEVDGKKKKMNKALIKIELRGGLVKDPSSSWEGKPWYKFLRESYDKFIIPKRIEDLTEKVALDVRAFKEELKSYLELYGRR
jgi:hypothetical protein